MNHKILQKKRRILPQIFFEVDFWTEEHSIKNENQSLIKSFDSLIQILITFYSSLIEDVKLFKTCLHYFEEMNNLTLLLVLQSRVRKAEQSPKIHFDFTLVLSREKAKG